MAKTLISVILAHPDSKSFNHAIAQTVIDAIKANEHIVFFHDLIRKNLIRCSIKKK